MSIDDNMVSILPYSTLYALTVVGVGGGAYIFDVDVDIDLSRSILRHETDNGNMLENRRKHGWSYWCDNRKQQGDDKDMIKCMLHHYYW